MVVYASRLVVLCSSLLLFVWVGGFVLVSYFVLVVCLDFVLDLCASLVWIWLGLVASCGCVVWLFCCRC